MTAPEPVTDVTVLPPADSQEIMNMAEDQLDNRSGKEALESVAAAPPGPVHPPAHPRPFPRPTQKTPQGIRYDFNQGCRVQLPDGRWRVVLRDLDTGNVVYETTLGAGAIASTKKYYIRFELEVWDLDSDRGGCQGNPPRRVLHHRYDASDQRVLVQFPIGTLGDTLGWFPYAVKFQRQHRCRLTCAMSPLIIPLFREAYPEIEFVSHEEVKPVRYYATYNLGLFFGDDGGVWQPCDFRHVGLHRTAGYILGVDPADQAPRISLADDTRPVAEPYVCIAVQSSTQCKYWNHPTGWREVVAFLKAHGYRVICIDQKPTHGAGMIWNHLPYGCEDETGHRPLIERARWLKHAEFFVGLSSGLAWLAWSVGIPVAMISGFTHPTNEFATPFRVINYHTCNSCWNDVRHRFDHGDFLWCPRHQGTPRQFECTRLITPEHVKATLRRMPGFPRGQQVI